VGEEEANREERFKMGGDGAIGSEGSNAFGNRSKIVWESQEVDLLVVLIPG